MTLNTKKIAIPVYCPDCGNYKGPIFFKGTEKGIKNEHCKCHNKSKGLGFDINAKAVNVKYTKDQSNNLIYCEATCSGIENEWIKKSTRCPVCNTFQFSIKTGDSGVNQKCKNPDCPTLGFNYGYIDNYAYTTASGIENEVGIFLNEKHNKSKMGLIAPIDKSNVNKCY